MRTSIKKLIFFLFLSAMAASCRPEVQGDGGDTPHNPPQERAPEKKPEPADQPDAVADTSTPLNTDTSLTDIQRPGGDSLGLVRRDTVIRPNIPVARKPSVMNMIGGMEDTRIFAEALKRAGMASALDRTGPYTVFVPTDKAFNALPRDMKRILVNPNPSAAEKVKLINILHYHVLLQEQSALLMNNNSKRSTAKGELLLFTVNPKATVIHGVRAMNNARIIRGDLDCSNGLVHVVDEVLIPKDTEYRDRKKDILKR